jgi:hypothetical protein
MSRSQPQPAPAWLRVILRAIKPLLPADFVGQIQINAFKGGITTAAVDQTYRYTESDDDHDGGPVLE